MLCCTAVYNNASQTGLLTRSYELFLHVGLLVQMSRIVDGDDVLAILYQVPI
jgi:hypothetical protein